jgi:Alginate export
VASAAGALALLACTQAWAESSGFEEAIAATKPIIDLRLRSENVQQTGIAEDAHALTLRGRLGFETGKAWNTALVAEAELVWPLDDNYNSTVNGKTQFPVVADPEDYALNRLQLTNTSIPATTMVLGRQRMNLDDQRFIGNSGWRQNEQTFDAFRITNRSIHDLTLDLAYIDQVNRVFGEDSPVGRYRGANYFANAAYQTSLGKLTGFLYLFDLDRAPTDSSQTLGLRFTGEHALSGITYAYSAAYASQQEYADNPLNYNDDYYALELGATVHQINVAAGIDVLEGNGVKGFTAPLGTLHKFQGWADKFLATPANGIDDRYLVLGYARKPLGSFDALSATANYHWFTSERLAIDYGSEFDLQLQLKRRQFTLTLMYADYSANSFATDTRKICLQLEYAP